jgi:hypothetical protein
MFFFHIYGQPEILRVSFKFESEPGNLEYNFRKGKDETYLERFFHWVFFQKFNLFLFWMSLNV